MLYPDAAQSPRPAASGRVADSPQWQRRPAAPATLSARAAALFLELKAQAANAARFAVQAASCARAASFAQAASQAPARGFLNHRLRAFAKQCESHQRQ